MQRARGRLAYPTLWAALALYMLARVLQLSTGHLPLLAVVVLHVVPAAFFALVHATLTYGRRTAAVFFAICLVTGSAFESLSLRTGFPFGHYYFTPLMGPQLFHLPLLLSLAYVGMGYASWAVANTILGYTDQPVVRSRIIAVALVASFLMVAWDLAMDPVWGTLQRAWVWRSGGAWFGVPVSNYLGWFLTVFVFYILFALYLWRHPPLPPPNMSIPEPRILAHDLLPILFYAVSAVGNMLLAIPNSAVPRTVTDPSGSSWRSSDILSACLLVSLFVMLPPAVLALIRLRDRHRERRQVSP